MDYKKVKLGDTNNIPQSMWSTDDNILCDNSKTLRENLAEKFDDAILEGNLLKLYSNGILKKTLTLPKRIVNVVKCSNPRCISNVEDAVDYEFVLTDNKGTYRCIYCETKANKQQRSSNYATGC